MTELYAMTLNHGRISTKSKWKYVSCVIPNTYRIDMTLKVKVDITEYFCI